MRRWLGVLAGAALTGCICAGLAWAADWAQLRFGHVSHLHPLLPLLVTPFGFAFCAWVTQSFFPGAQGSGIPQTMAARELPEPAALLSLKLVAGKFVLLVFGWLCGASAGRGGPSVQIAGAVMLRMARFSGADGEAMMILAGAAAGLAAAFNAPLAGIVFAVEIIGRASAMLSIGFVLVGAVLAWLTCLALFGDVSGFGATNVTAVGVRDWEMVIICGGLSGLLGGGFGRLLLAGKRWAARWLPSQNGRRRLLLPFGCGMVVALLGLATAGSTYGTGYLEAQAAVTGQAVQWSFAPAKFLATLATSMSGIPGGILTPTLVLGAGFGAWMAGIGGVAVSLGAVSGMAGCFAAAIQAPITAVVLVVEITGDRANVVALAVAALLGYGVSRLLMPGPLDQLLAEDFLAAVRDAASLQDRDQK